MLENKSKSGYYSSDTVETFTKVARIEGWNVMTRDAYEYVKSEVAWEDRDEMWDKVQTLISDVGYELTRFSRIEY